MNIVLIHEHGRAHGSGAVIAMYRLHEGLRTRGVKSVIACRKRGLDSSDIVDLPKPHPLERHLQRITWRLGLNDVHVLNSFRIKNEQYIREADVVNIHGFHSKFFNYLALPGLSKTTPVVATLHDVWPLTGHCSFTGSCEKWKTGCGSCPDLAMYPGVARDATHWEWKLKNWAYQRSNLHVVSPSKWLADQVRKSMLAHFPLHHINNGVDETVYRPLDKKMSRAALGLPADARIIVFASASFSNSVKGADLLLQSLKIVPESLKKNAIMLLLGDRGEAMAAKAGIPVVEMGYVFKDRIKALAYSAGDVFVLPSRGEVQGLVLMESLACGTPVVSFKVGGAAELSLTNETGYAAEPENVEDFAHGMTWVLDQETRRVELGQNGRALIEREFTIDQHVTKYMQLFQSIIEQRQVA